MATVYATGPLNGASLNVLNFMLGSGLCADLFIRNITGPMSGVSQNDLGFSLGSGVGADSAILSVTGPMSGSSENDLGFIFGTAAGAFSIILPITGPISGTASNNLGFILGSASILSGALIPVTGPHAGSDSNILNFILADSSSGNLIRQIHGVTGPNRGTDSNALGFMLGAGSVTIIRCVCPRGPFDGSHANDLGFMQGVGYAEDVSLFSHTLHLNAYAHNTLLTVQLPVAIPAKATFVWTLAVIRGSGKEKLRTPTERSTWLDNLAPHGIYAVRCLITDPKTLKQRLNDYTVYVGA